MLGLYDEATLAPRGIFFSFLANAPEAFFFTMKSAFLSFRAKLLCGPREWASPLEGMRTSHASQEAVACARGRASEKGLLVNAHGT